VAKKHDYTEEFGHYCCADDSSDPEKPKKGCGRKSPKQVKCCQRQMKYFDNLLFYFNAPTRFQEFCDRYIPMWCKATKRFWFRNWKSAEKWRNAMIEHEKKAGPVLVEKVTFVNRVGKRESIFLYSRLPLSKAGVQSWLEEFFTPPKDRPSAV